MIEDDVRQPITHRGRLVHHGAAGDKQEPGSRNSNADDSGSANGAGGVLIELDLLGLADLGSLALPAETTANPPSGILSSQSSKIDCSDGYWQPHQLRFKLQDEPCLSMLKRLHRVQQREHGPINSRCREDNLAAVARRASNGGPACEEAGRRASKDHRHV